ncbi:MAG: DUF6259 domain-containing protein [Armatimonadota bacterium]|nr:DUF6259 domain-containing protein [Armatimonadota bacterium]
MPRATFAVPPDEPLRVEAERASEITGPVEEVAAEEAGGGSYLHVPDGTYQGKSAAAILSVSIPEPGDYRLWVRTFWPDIGGNSFYLSLDGGEDEVFGNSEGPEVIGVWHWEPGPVWHLEPGLHTVRITWREDGTQLDLALLGRGGYEPSDATDLGLGAEPGPPPWLQVTTPELRPTSVVAWRDVAVRPAELAERAHIEASVDGGQSWQEAPGGDLSGLPVAGEGEDALRVRLRLDGPPEGAAIEAIEVTYDGGPWKATLSDDRVAFDFDLASGGCIGVRNLATGTILSRGRGPLFRLRYLPHDGGEVVAVPDEDVALLAHEMRQDPPAVDLRFRAQVPGGACEVLCHAELPADGLPRWWIEVTNRGEGIHMVEVHFPLIPGVRVGEHAEDDWLMWPRWGCRRIPWPARSAPGTAYYPSGRAMMNWLDVYEEGERPQGLYVASQDETVLMGALQATGGPDGETLTLGMSKMPRIRPGESFRTEDFVVAPHEGDWHWAADRYREWLYGWMRPYQPPEWVVDADGWLGSGRDGDFLRYIPSRYRLARRLGLSYVEFWGQMMTGLAAGESCCNRLYFPDPRYGTEEEFARAISYVRGAGGHIGFYTNGQAWNPRYPRLRPVYEGLLPDDALIPDWEGGFKRHALRQPDGSFYPQYAKPPGDESPYPCSFYLMCSHATGWQDYLHHYIVERYVAEYGVDAMYVDQVGAAAAKACYALGHGHDDYVGAWGRGHLRNFQRLKTDGREHEPHFTLATEGLADVYGQWVDIFLLSPVASRRWQHVAPEVIRYTLPDFICYDGFANGMAGATLSDRQTINEVFLLGNRFDIFERSEEVMAHIRGVLRLRQETGPLLYRGRFRDEIGLTVSDQRVRAKLWRLDTGEARGWLVNVLNEDAVEGASISVDTGDTEPARALCATLDQPLQPIEMTLRDGRASVEAPASELSTVLLLAESSPWLLRAMAPVTAAGNQSAVELRFRPLVDVEEGFATARLRVPEGWSAEPVRFATSRSRDVSLPFASPDGAPAGGHPVTVEVTIGDRTWTSQEHVLIEEPLEVGLQVQAGRLVAALHNRSDGDLTVECLASGPQWLRLPEPGMTLDVPAGEEAECVFPWQAPEGVPEAGTVTVTASAAGREYAAEGTLAPLDLSVARWDIARYEGTVGHSTRDDVLSISTPSQSDRGAWRWTTSMVIPGERYRFSVQGRTEHVRSTDGGALVRVIFFDRDDPSQGAGDWVMTDPLTGDTDWREVTAEFQVPERTGRIQVELFNWHAAGISHWRDPKLRRID